MRIKKHFYQLLELNNFAHKMWGMEKMFNFVSRIFIGKIAQKTTHFCRPLSLAFFFGRYLWELFLVAISLDKTNGILEICFTRGLIIMLFAFTNNNVNKIACCVHI